jgi:putative transcriptional regulator
VVEILRDGSERPLAPQVDWARVDATTEEEIAAQIAQDEAEAMYDAAAYARRVRRKIGLSGARLPHSTSTQVASRRRP